MNLSALVRLPSSSSSDSSSPEIEYSPHESPILLSSSDDDVIEGSSHLWSPNDFFISSKNEEPSFELATPNGISGMKFLKLMVECFVYHFLR